MTTDHSSCSVTPNNSRSCSPSCLAVTDDTNTYVKAEPTPVFLIYTDSELKLAANNDSLSDELRNRLVRNTWSNMRTACQNLRNPREPTAKEFEDMAKALVEKYPCVGQLYDEEKKDFRSVGKDERLQLTQEQKNKLHVSLNVCLYNTYFVRVEQGKRVEFCDIDIKKRFSHFLTDFTLHSFAQRNNKCQAPNPHCQTAKPIFMPECMRARLYIKPARSDSTFR